MPVRTMRRGMMRSLGFTDGPAIGTMFCVRRGPLSRGAPLPVNTRPISASENDTSIGLPRKRTSASVEMPRAPAKTCKNARPASRRITCASELRCCAVPGCEVTCASSR